jgi:hypothetical protein
LEAATKGHSISWPAAEMEATDAAKKALAQVTDVKVRFLIINSIYPTFDDPLVQTFILIINFIYQTLKN